MVTLHKQLGTLLEQQQGKLAAFAIRMQQTAAKLLQTESEQSGSQPEKEQTLPSPQQIASAGMWCDSGPA
jgi:hypothetical protein